LTTAIVTADVPGYDSPLARSVGQNVSACVARQADREFPTKPRGGGETAVLAAMGGIERGKNDSMNLLGFCYQVTDAMARR
jgi:hypothetical protein